MTPSRNLIAYYRDRCKSPLTQVTLAQALGVHVNTIQHWEKRGVPSPADLLRLVELFAECGAIADDETAVKFWEVSGREQFPIPPELHQFFRAAPRAAARELPLDTLPPPAPLPPGSLMPLRRNHLFVGRAEELRALAAALAPLDATAVISGIAGMGKTQLACEFAHRYGQFFPGGILWISFADAGAVAAGVAACGGAGYLDLRPDFETLPLDKQARLVLASWRAPAPRLLVFDNCEDEALLAEWRPPSGGCRVLVTSRRARWCATLVTRVLPLRVFERAESIALLRRHRPDLPDDNTQLDAIAEQVGDLPLALHLAGSFLDRYRDSCTPDDYLRQLGAELLTHPSFVGDGFSPTKHEHHLERTFIVSYGQLDRHRQADALALRLLNHAAYFTLVHNQAG